MLAFVSVLTLLFTSCQKELSGHDPDGFSTQCQLAKITYYDETTGAVADTAGIYYNNDKISQIYLSGYRLHLVYTNERVSRINYLDVNNAYYDVFDSISYNNTGQIASLIVYSTGTGVNVPTSGYVIGYDAEGKPEKVVEKAELGNGMEDAFEYLYTYAQQNVTSMLITDLVTADIMSISYTADTAANIFNKLPTEFIFADNLMFGISGVKFGYFSPFLFSKNNITTMQGLPVTYETDGQGNITALLVNGKKLATYTYNCK